MAISEQFKTGQAGVVGQTPLESEDYVPRVLPRILRTRDMIALYIMAVFWMSNVTGVATGGAAAFSYWLICSIAFFIPCAGERAAWGNVPQRGLDLQLDLQGLRQTRMGVFHRLLCLAPWRPLTGECRRCRG